MSVVVTLLRESANCQTWVNTEKEQNKQMPSAGIEPATYRSSVFRANSANKGNIGRISRCENFSGLAGKPSDRDFPDYEDINNGKPYIKDGREIRGIPGCSVAEWFNKNGRHEDFDRWYKPVLVLFRS